MDQHPQDVVDPPYVSRLEETKARMMAAVKRDMFPEFQLLFDKLNGDAVTVRDTILEAFRKSWLEGFDKLATACSMPANAPMRQRLVAVIGKLGRYMVF